MKQHVRRSIIPSLKVIGLVLLIQVFASLVAILVAYLLNVFNVTSENAPNYFYFVIYLTISLIIILILALVQGIRWHNRKDILKEFEIKKIRSREWGYILAGYTIYFIAVLGVFAVIQHWPIIDLNQPQEVGFSGTAKGAELAFMALVILVPVYEELLMRGFLYRRLKQHLSFYPALIVASLAFAALHFNWAVMIDTLLLSVVIIVVYQKTKNLTTAIVIHAIKNLVAVLSLVIELNI